MRLDVYVHVVDECPKTLERILDSILTLRNRMMASQAELAADLQTVKSQVEKIGTETAATLRKVTDLEEALAAAGGTTPEVDEAVRALKEQVKVVDDLVADPPTV